MTLSHSTKRFAWLWSNIKRSVLVLWKNATKADTGNLDFESLSDTVKNILVLGTEINNLLAEFVEGGKRKGIVRQDVVPLMTVYILWSGMTSLLTLAQTKDLVDLPFL